MINARDFKPAEQVSVVIPAYNAGATLRATLLTLAAQTLRPFEVIVIDDGSTDRTVEIARSFSRRLPNLRVISTANGGVSRARNLAIREATGDFIATLDSDDIWHPEYLERMVRHLVGRPDCGLVFCPFRRVNSRGMILRHWSTYGRQGWAFYQILAGNFGVRGSNAIYRRALFDQVGLYDTTLPVCEDFHLLSRCAWVAPLAYLPEYLVGYREVAGSLTKNERAICEARLQVLRKLAAEFPTIDRKVFRKAKSEAHRLLAATLTTRRSGTPLEVGWHRVAALWLDFSGTIEAGRRRGELRPSAAEPSSPLFRQPFLETDPTVPGEARPQQAVLDRLAEAREVDEAHGRSAAKVPAAQRLVRRGVT
jgi:glycosyltransferase involved in cell wall biosynthesis